MTDLGHSRQLELGDAICVAVPPKRKRARKPQTYRMRLYAERKLARQCVDCGVDLTVADKSIRCATHRAAELARNKAYKAKADVRLVARDNERELRNERRTKRQCVDCKGSLQVGDRSACAECRRQRREKYAARIARRTGRIVTTRIVTLGPRMPMLRAPIKHKLLTKSSLPVPDGWTIEADIREELLALSEIAALRKVG